MMASLIYSLCRPNFLLRARSRTAEISARAQSRSNRVTIGSLKSVVRSRVGQWRGPGFVCCRRLHSLPQDSIRRVSPSTAPRLACQTVPVLIAFRLSLLPVYSSREANLPPPFMLPAAAGDVAVLCHRLPALVEYRHSGDLCRSTPGALAPVRGGASPSYLPQTRCWGRRATEAKVATVDQRINRAYSLLHSATQQADATKVVATLLPASERSRSPFCDRQHRARVGTLTRLRAGRALRTRKDVVHGLRKTAYLVSFIIMHPSPHLVSRKNDLAHSPNSNPMTMLI